jgi:hypothetical protein
LHGSKKIRLDPQWAEPEKERRNKGVLLFLHPSCHLKKHLTIKKIFHYFKTIKTFSALSANPAYQKKV